VPPVVPALKQQRFVKLRTEGWSRKAACSEVGVSESWAFKFEHGRHNTGEERRRRWRQEKLPQPIPFDRLCAEAQRGLDDFEFFRWFYLGHVSTPWQVETANAGGNAGDAGEGVRGRELRSGCGQDDVDPRHRLLGDVPGSPVAWVDRLEGGDERAPDAVVASSGRWSGRCRRRRRRS
jgi:hypothetical protein